MEEDLKTSFASSVLDNSGEANLLKGFEPMVEECGFRANVFPVQNGHRMNVSISGVGPENIEGYLACVPMTIDRQFELHPSSEDGWFFRYFEFSGSITSQRCNSEEPADPSEPDTKRLPSEEARELNYSFPREIAIAMPGSIVSLDVQSDVVGGRYIGSQQGGTARIEWESRHPQFAEAPRNRHCESLPSRQREAEIDSLRATITSRQAKFDLNTVLAVLGIIVSSGIVLELWRRLLLAGSNKKRRRRDHGLEQRKNANLAAPGRADTGSRLVVPLSLARP